MTGSEVSYDFISGFSRADTKQAQKVHPQTMNLTTRMLIHTSICR